MLFVICLVFVIVDNILKTCGPLAQVILIPRHVFVFVDIISQKCGSVGRCCYCSSCFISVDIMFVFDIQFLLISFQELW